MGTWQDLSLDGQNETKNNRVGVQEHSIPLKKTLDSKMKSRSYHTPATLQHDTHYYLDKNDDVFLGVLQTRTVRTIIWITMLARAETPICDRHYYKNDDVFCMFFKRGHYYLDNNDGTRGIPF